MHTDGFPSREFRLSDGRYECERWEYGNVDDVPVGSSRRMTLDHHGYDYGFSSNRLRVDKEEIHRSPPQKKKSVLLRIQAGKANNRIRNQDNDLNRKQKKQDVFGRLERRVEGRQGSPMELDVSFKSNALVAKAIMTPSSSPVVDSYRSETPSRRKKIRKLNLSGSSMKKVEDNFGKRESSANGSGQRSSTRKESKRSDTVAVSAGGSSSSGGLNSKMDAKSLVDKITDSAGGHTSEGTLNFNKESNLLPDKVADSTFGSASNNTPLRSSIGTSEGTAERKGSPEIMVLNQGSNQVGKEGTPVRKIRKNRKKKKALNRVSVDPCNAIGTLKKATLARQQDEDVVRLVERTTLDNTTLEDVNMKLPLSNLVSEVQHTSIMTVVSEDETIEQSMLEREKASTAKDLVCSSNMDSEVNNFADNACRSVRCPSMLNSTCMIEVEKTSTSFTVNSVGGPSQDEIQVPRDGLIEESSEAIVCVEGNCDVVLSSLHGCKIPTSFAADNVSGHSQDELQVSGDGLIKESSETMVCVEGNCNVALLSLDGSRTLTSCAADNVGGHSKDELRLSEDGLIRESSEAMVCVEGNVDVVLSSLGGSKMPAGAADNVGGHSQDEIRVSEGGLIRETSEPMVCVEGNDNVVLSSLEGSKILEGEVSSATVDTYISSVSDLRFSGGKENAAAVIGSLKACSRESSNDPKIVPLQTNIEKGSQESFLNGSDGNDRGSSSEPGRIVVVDDLLSTECLSSSGPAAGTFGGSVKRPCIDWVTVSPEMNHTEGSVGAMVSVGDDTTIPLDDDCLPKFARKRKTRDAQSAVTTTKTSETEGNMFSSLLAQSKNFSCLREDHSTRVEEVTVPGDGYDSPKWDRSEVGLSRQDFSKEDSKTCSVEMPKKRKVSSPRLVKYYSGVTTTHEGSSSTPITVPLINDVSVRESQKTLSNAEEGPPTHPSVILHERSTAKAVCQVAPSEANLMDYFTDGQQVIACNSQLGASRKEPTPSALAIEMSRMAFEVSTDEGPLGVDQKLALEDHKCHNYVLGKEDVPFLANSISFIADSNCSSVMKASVGGGESVPNVSTLVPSPEDLPNNSVSEEPTKSSISNEIVIAKNQNVTETSIAASAPVSCSVKRSSDTSEFGRSLDHKVDGVPRVNVNTVPLLSQGTVKSPPNVSSLSWKPSFSANQKSAAAPRVLSGRPSPSFITSRNMPVLKKPLTWCRTDNNSSSVIGRGPQKNYLSPQSHLPKDIGKVSSYIRKGNSLVRKPSPVGSVSKAYCAPSSSVYRLNSSGVNYLNRKPEDRKITDSLSCKGAPEVSAPSERPKTPPQIELFGCITKSTSLPVVDYPRNGSIATKSELLEVTDNMLALKPSEQASTSSPLPQCHIGLRGMSENQETLDEGTSAKKIIYVKKRSNQLVAASDNAETLSSGYYKRRKNQLVRACSTNHMKQSVGAAENIVPIRRGLARTPKWSKSSLVWKLGDAQSSRKDGSTVGYEKLWPNLFPWKRASYRKSFLSSSPIDNPTSFIRRKLLLAKKRETIYTRSIHGLSLRRSKVLSISGSSLKWSKSIEQRSKKAVEDAVRAVAAVEKRKRGRDGSKADPNNANNVSRERIFRIGCERYKMDPSGKTLQRISDNKPSVSVPEVKKSYVPKRLLIGNDEYVRVGNGNKLVRNPKRRVRVLASEKVRWSLHTARVRLARKKQYCQFFTRFGKCNKDNGKCPYIHDPSKIAVCTKFLNGSCADTSCKLTHEVIPERMQDCSYFLQGICSNENCPYRHVNVNPSASICEGFLRGYCADGNECRKKHTYVCPAFEATGSCAQGSKCKLHHPKNKRKGVKRKANGEMKNVQGRYFGSPHIDISERITAGSEKPCVNGNNDIFFKEGKFVDFISVDGSDEEEQTIEQRSEETLPMGESGSAEMQLDELIKPMRLLLYRNRSVNSSPLIGSPSDRTTSYVSEDSFL